MASTECVVAGVGRLKRGMCRDAAPEDECSHAIASTTSERVSADKHKTYVYHNFIVLSSDVSYAVT